MFSFKNDLGIIPNEGTSLENDMNLAQGQQFMEYSRIYAGAIKPHLYKLQLTSSPALQSITEAINGNDSTLAANKTIQSSVLKSEDDFNKTLSEYSQVFNELNKEIMLANTNNKLRQKYFNTNVTADDTNFTYVNNYGYTHKYTNDTWQNKNQNCASLPLLTIDNSEMATVTQDKFAGPDMLLGQTCGIAGQNIQNGSTNEVAWVDTKGTKHVYSAKSWQQKSNSCGSDLKVLDATTYNVIPTGSPMTETSSCNKSNVNLELIEKLAKLNDKLIKHAEKINSDIGNLNVNDDKLKKNINDQQQSMKQYIGNLNKDKMKFAAHMNGRDLEYNSVVGQAEVSQLSMRSNYFHYIIWIFLVFLVLFMTVHAITNDSYGGIIVVVSIVCLYIFLQHFFIWA